MERGMSLGNNELREKLESYIDAAFDEKGLEPFLKQVRDIGVDLVDTFEIGIKDYAAANLASWVQEMAEQAVTAFLRGDVDEMRRYLRCASSSWTGRDREHWVIHGKLSEHDPMVLRKQIVDAHAELLKNERILDLEDQVASLVRTINKLEREKEEMWQRVISLEGR